MSSRHSHKTFLALVFMIIAGYVAWTLLRPLPPTTAIAKLPNLTPTTVALNWPERGQAAVGAIGYGILATHGSQKPAPMASTAKLLTALAILAKHPLSKGQAGPSISLSAADVAIYKSYVAKGGSVIPVKAGGKITELQALQAMLLPSANNIAASAAIWAFGSTSNFLTYANNYAKQLGLAGTNLADASGFSPKSVSTATDLAQLGQIALDNDVLAAIVATKQVNLPLASSSQNVNWLLGIDGIDGIKTGNTDQAGGCFVFSSSHQIGDKKVRIVGAIMQSPNLAVALTNGRNLSNSAVAGFKLITPVQTGQVVGEYKSAWGAHTSIEASGVLSAVVWAPQSTPLSSSLVPLNENEPADHSVGSINWQVGNDKLTVGAKIAQPLAGPGIGWRLTHPF